MSKKISKLLNKYIMMSPDNPEKNGLFNQLRRDIYSPSLVVECSSIPGDHPLKKESIILADSFEALTNGMINEEILQELDGIPSASLLFQWKPFIRAVQAFYEKDSEECLRHSRSIPEETAPSCFKPLFETLMKREAPEPQWSRLTGSILEDNRDIHDSLDLIGDSVGMEDILLDTAGMLIRDLIRDDPGTAGKIMIWCLEQLQQTDILSDKAVSRVKQLFGNQEGYRLAALTTLHFDPDRSLVFWLHSLTAYLDCANTSLGRVRAYLNILRDVADSVVLEFELTSEYISLITSLVSELSDTLRHVYPEIQGIESPADDPFRTLSRMAGEKQRPPAVRKTRELSTGAVQLELFAL